jgi:hypothetical protein
MTRLTRFYNTLKICRDCMDEYVLEYAIAYEPPCYSSSETEGCVGRCSICGKTAILITVKYATVLRLQSDEEYEKSL